MRQVEIRLALSNTTTLRSGYCSMRPARSLSSATVFAVIVLIGEWSNVTWQYLGLRRHEIAYRSLWSRLSYGF
jgi:hypothetical protein